MTMTVRSEMTWKIVIKTRMKVKTQITNTRSRRSGTCKGDDYDCDIVDAGFPFCDVREDK